jgi:hypothetical protein
MKPEDLQKKYKNEDYAAAFVLWQNSKSNSKLKFRL